LFALSVKVCKHNYNVDWCQCIWYTTTDNALAAFQTLVKDCDNLFAAYIHFTICVTGRKYSKRIGLWFNEVEQLNQSFANKVLCCKGRVAGLLHGGVFTQILPHMFDIHVSWVYLIHRTST